ncbi:putative ribosome biogenesis protein [Lachnellula hyalina]|uniref:Putative ribosome biogenesis protein n=1 Tax=Lachnellula hyalina TaxID=1316788 RepID=A0A8H8TUX5_9HELO|nr:putative ribosome biogenesis protein [Lachnellula hyalina]TVY23289.1 putative ribosome biogenesis protein [Lachnellula hyalina]
MAPNSTALTTKVESGSPYQLNHEQTLKASKALLKHMKDTETEVSTTTEKKNLLDEADDDETSSPIWLTLSTKKHIVDKTRLKPSKIALPHPLNTSSTQTICLITADPQRTYKDIVASPAFPSALAARITKVVGIKKIRAKHSQYEAQRKLKSEHDIFLADDRIITSLPKLLGKTMYKGGSKRPIPISISAPVPKTDGKRIKAAKGEEEKRDAASGQAIAKEIEKALSGTVVNLSASSSTAVKIGFSNWDAAKLAENAQAVAEALIEKHVPAKWRGVRGLHIKGERTAALPIWLADELWADEADVISEEKAEQIKLANVGKKRKAVAVVAAADEEEVVAEGTRVKGKKQKLLVESNDDKLDKEIRERKETLRKQKEEAAKDVVDEVPKASKKSKSKSKKGKAVAV